MGIKDYLVRVKKNGKTKGRPSKYELFASRMMSDIMAKNKDAFNKANEDLILYGKGIMKIDYPEIKEVIK